MQRDKTNASRQRCNRCYRCGLAASFLVLSINLLSGAARFYSPLPVRLDDVNSSATPRSMQVFSATPRSMQVDAGRVRVSIDTQSGKLEIKTSRGTHVAASSAAGPYVHFGGTLHQLHLKAASTHTGCDAIGCYTSIVLEWGSVASPEPLLTSSVRAYAALDSVVFSQHFPRALHGTSSGLPCGFISGPAAGLFNDCGLASAFPRLSLGGSYRNWLSWAGGGNSPEPAFGSFDAMRSEAAFFKDGGQVGGTGGSVARGLLTIAYDGRAREARTVKQELDAISLQPPWGRGKSVNYSRAKAFCVGERRCRGFSWQSLLPRDSDVEPAPGVLANWRFVTDTPADGKGRVPIAFYASAAATNLGGLVAAPILLPCGRSLNETVALTALSNFMSSSHEYNVATGTLDMGVLGSIRDLPAGFTAEWLVTVGDGFNGALRKAGSVVLKRAGTANSKREHAVSDVSLNTLGYATQQGAWYYYNTAPRPAQGVDAAKQDRPDSLAPVVDKAPRMWGERYATAGSFGCAVNVSEPPAQQCKSCMHRRVRTVGSRVACDLRRSLAPHGDQTARRSWTSSTGLGRCRSRTAGG